MKQLPQIYSQRDPRWAAQRLGTVDGTTIGQYGCYITCFAMVAGYFGHEITPNALDDIFTNNHWYYNTQGNHDDPANELADTDLTKAFSDIQFVEVDNYQDSPADLGKLKKLLSDPNQIIILEIDFDHDPSDGIQTHFVVCVDCDGTNIKIADPWYGTVDDFTTHYGNNPAQTILKFVVYKGTPPQQTIPVPTDKFSELVDKSTKYDAFHAAGYTTVDDVIKKVGDLSNENSQAQSAIATLNGKIAQLTTTIQADAQQDYDLSSKNLTLEKTINDICGDLDIPQNSSEDIIRSTIQALKAPHDELVKNVQPTIDALADAAIKKTRSPQVKSFGQQIKDVLSKFFKRG